MVSLKGKYQILKPLHNIPQKKKPNNLFFKRFKEIKSVFLQLTVLSVEQYGVKKKHAKFTENQTWPIASMCCNSLYLHCIMK